MSWIARGSVTVTLCFTPQGSDEEQLLQWRKTGPGPWKAHQKTDQGWSRAEDYDAETGDQAAEMAAELPGR